MNSISSVEYKLLLLWFLEIALKIIAQVTHYLQQDEAAINTLLFGRRDYKVQKYVTIAFLTCRYIGWPKKVSHYQ